MIGPNGAGKTTLFNCITGFYRPSSGAIRAAPAGASADRLCERLPGYRIARAGVARTFQNIRLFPGMTVLENLLVAQHNELMRGVRLGIGAVLGLSRYRRAEKEAVERARRWLDATGLLDRADDPAGACLMARSGGWRSRAPCAPSPSLLCLDEPAAGLNPRESDELARLLLDIRDQQGIAHPADRARHGRGDAHLRPRRGAGPWRARSPTARRRGARRPQGHRRLSRRGRRGRAAAGGD